MHSGPQCPALHCEAPQWCATHCDQPASAMPARPLIAGVPGQRQPAGPPCERVRRGHADAARVRGVQPVRGGNLHGARGARRRVKFILV